MEFKDELMLLGMINVLDDLFEDYVENDIDRKIEYERVDDVADKIGKILEKAGEDSELVRDIRTHSPDNFTEMMYEIREKISKKLKYLIR